LRHGFVDHHPPTTSYHITENSFHLAANISSMFVNFLQFYCVEVRTATFQHEFQIENSGFP
tara:strand:+ start:8871 stop:9053 length:183 start_codon:yes stop_codon:yes gene_type:complete